jgi:hypothetical protein
MKTGAEFAEIEIDANKDDSVSDTVSHDMIIKPFTRRARNKLQAHSSSV